MGVEVNCLIFVEAIDPSQSVIYFGIMSFLKDKKIIVTGGAGFLGKRVVDLLKEKGPSGVFVPRIEEFDLRKEKVIEKLLETVKPNIIIHLAAVVGGIGFNRKYPGTLFYDNLIMGMQLMESARRSGVEKFVTAGTICAYPKFTPVPFKEDALWDGYPEETNAPYGIAKKALLVQGQAYRKQYGFNSIFLLPVNLYGPGDNFDPESSHVIPALIKKCFDAIDNNEQKITVWGDGTPTREFLFVDDAARAIVTATEKYDGEAPVNLGSSYEISIKNLVSKITTLTGFKGDVVWDKSKPGGQPRRLLDTEKAAKEFGFRAEVSLDEGLRQTVKWYRDKRKEASSS